MFSRINDAIFNRTRLSRSRHCGDGPLREFLKTPAPSLSCKLVDLEFLVADLEMTGLDPKTDKILSIGTTLIKAKEIDHSNATHQLVFQDNADLTVSAPIHRIFNQDVAQGVPLEQALNEFLSQLSGRVLVLHHATLDKGFLDAALTDLYATGLVCRTIDTMQIERRRLKYQGREAHQINLASCRQRYRLPAYTAHNAAIDALATAELLLAQLSHIDPNNDLPLSYLT